MQAFVVFFCDYKLFKDTFSPALVFQCLTFYMKFVHVLNLRYVIHLVFSHRWIVSKTGCAATNKAGLKSSKKFWRIILELVFSKLTNSFCILRCLFLPVLQSLDGMYWYSSYRTLYYWSGFACIAFWYLEYWRYYSRCSLAT